MMLFKWGSLIFFLYIFWRTILPLNISKTIKVLLSVLVLAASLKFVWIKAWGGTLAAPEAPSWILLLSSWLHAGVVLLFLMLLVRDIIGLLWRLGTHVGLPRVSLLTPAQWSVTLTIAALILSGWGIWQALRVPPVKTVEIALNRLPADLDGFTIVQLSDLHASKLMSASRMEGIVEEVNNVHADVILITGDLYDGSPEEHAKNIAPLANLSARYGVFYALGNHEYYSDIDAWRNDIEKNKLHLLENAHHLIHINNHVIAIGGVTDPVASRFNKPEPDVSKTFENVPAEALRILMAHQPREAKTNANAGVDLQLSGHTHGGQILGVNLLTRSFNNGFVEELYDVGNMKLYVNRGTGLWTGFPIRLGEPAEITRIVLRSAQK